MDNNGYTLIRNVRMILPAERKAENCDILFTGRVGGMRSRIVAIGQGITIPEDRPIRLYDAGSKPYSPAFVDTACYVPNQTGYYAENYSSAAQAACAGGYGTVAVLPTANNALDTPGAISAFMRDCRLLDVRFLPIASFAVSERNKYRLADLEGMKNAGAVAFAPPDRRHLPPELVLDAMHKASEWEMPVFCPISGMHFSNAGAVNAGRIAKFLHVPGIPRCAELLSVAENLLLAAESDCRIHIPIVSLAESVEYIREAKKRGVKVTCGTAPHYFSLTEDDLVFRGVNAKLDPPLRKESDCQAIIDGLRDGTIDCIASDHRPCTREEKGTQIATGEFGAAGLETTFAVGFTYLVLTGKLDLFTLIEKMTEAPAQILGVPGTLKQGGRMDLVMIDEEKDMIYTNHTLRGRGLNTPYYGTPLRGGIGDRFIDGK